MKVALNVPEQYYGPVKGMLNILLPDLDIGRREEINAPELVVTSQLTTKAGVEVQTKLQGPKKLSRKLTDKEILGSNYTEQDFKRRSKSLIKLSIYQLLCEYLNQSMSPWGILVGVRPTKIGHFLLDKGLDYQQIDSVLQNTYGIKAEKRELLLAVIKKERDYLPSLAEAREKIGIYLGIPFCPTRCDYCSFASYPLADYEQYLADFLAALHYEIKQLGKRVQKLGFTVDTVYIGGGTPTVLTVSQLDQVLSWIKENFPLGNLEEFTVEAGRPDTITRDKLELLTEAGVGRISINPQTMNQATLDRIGRSHTVNEVKQAIELARKVGFDNINMDLIAGLPGEADKEISQTVDEVKKLAPESLTIHTLTVKRAAKLNHIDFSLPTAEEVSTQLVQLKKLAVDLNLEPYYMYRQKGSLGNFENIGYAQPGFESPYNMFMMEERKTILGLGGGAVSKFVKPDDWSLEREINPKFPDQYIKEINSRTENRVAKLTSLAR